MSLSSPYGQNSGGSGDSPLGGPSIFGTQNWGSWQPQGGSFSPTPQPAPQTSLNGIQSGSAVAPPGITSGADSAAPQSSVIAPVPMIPPTMGSSQAPQSVTSGASDPTSMMVNALAQPTQQINPLAFAPQNTQPTPVPAPPANPLAFATPGAAAPVPMVQPQNPYGF